MKLNAQDLKRIVNLILEHYNQRAEEFRAGTRDHDDSTRMPCCPEKFRLLLRPGGINK
jgi:hypothetical protein